MALDSPASEAGVVWDSCRSMSSTDRHGSILPCGTVVHSVMRFRLCLLSKSVCCWTLCASAGFVRGCTINDKQRKQSLANSSAERIAIQVIQQMYYLWHATYGVFYPHLKVVKCFWPCSHRLHGCFHHHCHAYHESGLKRTTMWRA